MYSDSDLAKLVLLFFDIKIIWDRTSEDYPSVNSFKNRLDKHWASQELRYDWEAELSGTSSRSRVEF